MRHRIDLLLAGSDELRIVKAVKPDVATAETSVVSEVAADLG